MKHIVEISLYLLLHHSVHHNQIFRSQFSKTNKKNTKNLFLYKNNILEDLEIISMTPKWRKEETSNSLPNFSGWEIFFQNVGGSIEGGIWAEKRPPSFFLG